VLRTTGALGTSDATMMTSLRQKVAALGGNGVIYPVLAAGPSSLADIQGEARAIMIPSDTARIGGECRAEAQRQTTKDSLRCQARNPGAP
jgi:hypothetical protein